MRAYRFAVASVIAVFCAAGLVACGGGDDGATADGTGTATTDGKEADQGAKVDSSQAPVRLALIATDSPVIDLMTGMSAGAEAAAAKINAEGGFGGREVIVETCETDLTPATAAVCANKTVNQEGLVADIGCEVSWGVSGLETYSRAGIPSLNCVNQEAEMKSDWAFGIHPGSSGLFSAMATALCEQDDVQVVGMLGQDLPTQRVVEKEFTDPILEGCGKEIHHVYASPSLVDQTPFVSEVLDDDPDFIFVTHSSGSAVQAFIALRSAGWPAEKTAVQESVCSYETLTQGGDAMVGTHCIAGWIPWSETDDPDIAEYVDAMEQYSDVDPRDTNPQYTYGQVMAIYTAAQKIGFENFDAESLTKFLRSESFDFPTSRRWVNPPVAPEFKAIKQPSAILSTWDGEGLVPVEDDQGPGWINGYEAYRGATK